MLLLLFAYVGGYSALRTTGEFVVLVQAPSPRFNPSAADWLNRGDSAVVWVQDIDLIHNPDRTWRTRLFRPCIAVEEWWRNR